MRKKMKKVLSIVLSLTMTFSVQVLFPTDFQNVVKAEESIVTSFNYDFAYSTPGYADGTIYVKANEDGVYKVFWGDEEGEKLVKNGHEYSYLARVIVQNGVGSYNIENDYTAIPEGAKTVLLYKQNEKAYTYNIPESKQFQASANSYTFGSISDPHFTRYSSVAEDDAVPAMDKALEFFDNIGIEFVAMSGDLSQAGEQLAFDRYNAALAKYPDMTVLTTTGNHDSRTTLSTSNKALLDTGISRWYNSITSKYFTVDEDGTVHNKLNGYEILANDALENPIATVYKESEDGEAIETSVPGLDFVTEAGGNIFIFFHNIAKTGETYDTDKLVTTGQLDWLEEQLEAYKDKNVFVYQHYYLGINPSNGDATDYNNCVGDLKNAGGYSYDLDFKDVVKTTSGKNLQTLLTEYKNATLVSGHSHWQYSMQAINKNINFGRLANGNGGTLVHLSSVTEPRYIAEDDPHRTSLNGYASEGATITTYDDCTVYNNIDFQKGQYEAYATYIAQAGNDSRYAPVKIADYKESDTAITGDNYLEAEDMTDLQLLKSDFNLLKGAAYTYSSKGTENTDTALTDGSSTGSFCNTKWGAKAEQRVTVALDGVQEVSNLKNVMLYYASEISSSKNFTIQLSLDGENFETVYTSPVDYSYKNTTIDINTSGVSLSQYQYVRLNLLDGAKDYGFQIRELAVIGYERNATPNTAGSFSSLEEGAPIDESEYLMTDYNLTYAADYTQSSVGSENTDGALTDGTNSGGFLNTERSSSAKEQTIVIDLGKSKVQEISNINYLLFYNQNAMTNVTDWEVSVSLDGENYESIGKYSDVDLEQEHFDVDLTNVTLDKFRYVKLHFTDGNTDYGYQIKEFAVIGINPVEYPEISDQTTNVSSAEKNMALNKTVYVSSTYAGESKDKSVLTDGKKEGYWSSDWDSSRASDWVVIDMEEEIDASLIGRVLVNYKDASTFCKNYTIEVSKSFDEENPEEGFYEIGRNKAVSWEILQKSADLNGYVATEITDVASDMVRYVKVNMQGHATYGFQIYEIAVIKKSDPPVTETKNMEECNLHIGDIVPVYNGTEQTVPVVVTNNGEQLRETVDYTVSYENNINAGTAMVIVTGIGDYQGEISESFEIAKADIATDMVTKDFSNVKSQYEYIDMLIQPPIRMKQGTYNLSSMKDYEIDYADNNYPGTATMTIKGVGNYTGTLVKTFTITKRLMANTSIKTNFDANKQLIVTVMIPNNGRALVYNTDYTYTAVTDVTGKITITVTGIGRNCQGTMVKVIPAEDNPNRPAPTTTAAPKKITVKKVKVKKAVNVKGNKIRLSWKKVSGVSGYHVRYALSKKKLKKAKIKKIKKTKVSYLIKKLRKKRYYIQIRAYKVSDKKKYYGAWSKIKKVKINK